MVDFLMPIATMKKLPSMARCLLLACAALTSHAQTTAPPTPMERTIRMQPYVRCFSFDDGLQAISFDGRPKNLERWREVKIGESSRRISVVNGVRLVYAYPGNGPFARMMVEQSDWNSYVEDVQTAQQALEETARDSDAHYQLLTLTGASGQSVTKKQMAGETLGSTELYFDADRTIVTVYYLHPAPDKARFKSLQEFSSLRERFEAGYVQCVARKRQDWQTYWEKILAYGEAKQKNGGTDLPVPTPP